MDLLAKRYANPYLILDDFIRLHQLHDFACEIVKVIADEKVQEARWEYYLHKVWDMSFNEYVASCEISQEQEKMSNEAIVNAIDNSKSMLEGFMPE